MSDFTRVYITPEGAEVRIKVVVGTDEAIQYTLPDGRIHYCYQRDAAGKPECWWVNELAAAAL